MINDRVVVIYNSRHWRSHCVNSNTPSSEIINDQYMFIGYWFDIELYIYEFWCVVILRDCYGTICKTAPFVKWCTICHKIGTKY